MKNRIRIALISLALVAGHGCSSQQQSSNDPIQNMSNLPDGLVRKEMAYPTGDRATSAVVVEKIFPAEVIASRPFSYEIKVTNISKVKLDGVKITEAPSNSMSVTDASDALDPGEEGSVVWQLGVLTPGETKTLRISATADSAGDLGSCTKVTYDSALCLNTNAVSPSIKVAASAPSEILVCDNIPVNFTVINNGTGLARNIKVNVQLPEGITTAEGQNSFSFDAGTLTNGQSKDFTINAKATRGGEFTFGATAKADNELSAQAKPVKTTVRQPILNVAREGTEKQFVGRPITYRIVVTNTGDAPAKQTILTENLAPAAKFASATEGGFEANGKVTWELGEIAPGATREVALTLSGLTIGDLKNTAQATAKCAADATAISQTNVTGIHGVLFEVVDSLDPVLVGETTTYDIVVTNQGSAAATNVNVKALTEEGMELVKVEGPTEGTIDGAKASFEPLASLAPQAKAVWKVTIKATKRNDARFKAWMTSDQLRRPVEKVEATNFYE